MEVFRSKEAARSLRRTAVAFFTPENDFDRRAGRSGHEKCCQTTINKAEHGRWQYCPMTGRPGRPKPRLFHLKGTRDFARGRANAAFLGCRARTRECSAGGDRRQ